MPEKHDRILVSPARSVHVRRIVVAVIGGMLVLGMIVYVAAGLGRLDYLSRILSGPVGAVSITRLAREPIPVDVSYDISGTLAPGQTFYSLSRGLGFTAGEVSAAVQAAKPVDLTRLAAGMPYRAMMEPSGRVQRLELRIGGTWVSLAWEGGRVAVTEAARKEGE